MLQSGEAVKCKLADYQLSTFSQLLEAVKFYQGSVYERMETEFLKNILKSISVSGYEEPLQNIVREEMQNVADEIREDEMHNLVCVANPDSPVRILLSAHADEIGLMISNITEDGRLQVVDRGGVVVPTYPGQQVIVKTKEREIPGVVEAYRGLFEKQG